MPANRTTAYRYPYEEILLFGTLLIVVAVIALTATATVCLSGASWPGPTSATRLITRI
jgi:hypothetical protein